MIEKAPSDSTKFRRNEIYSKSARTVFRHLLEWLEFGRSDLILLPSYIGVSLREGSGVLDPVRESGIGHDFYRVNEDLSADIRDIEAKIQSKPVKAVFLIHYFGINQSDVKSISTLCSDNGILLIEDCAHCMTFGLDGDATGTIGDFSIFSIHKVLPVMDGGMLRVNNGAMLPPICQDRQISEGSLEIYTTSLLAEIGAVRTQNYRKLSSYLSSVKGIARMYPEIDRSVVPLNFPVLIMEKSRFAIYNLLRKRGIEAIALYYKLVDEIAVEDYPVSHKISEKILNLPIHQEIGDLELTTIAETLEDVL